MDGGRPRDGDEIETAPVFDRVSASKSVVAAATVAGLDASMARLIRFGDGAVFRLPREDVVARVARSMSRMPDAEREVRVARWLVTEGFPAVQAVDVEQPVVSGGRIVTFWRSANDEAVFGTVGDLARLLRRLHSLTPPDPLGLSALAPLDRTLRRIQTVSGLAEGDRAFLHARCDALNAAYQRLTFELTTTLIHGDASIGNVIRNRHGSPVLADLDGFAIGPPEWDLTLTAVYFDRLGWHTADEYEQFATIYGYDVMASAAYPVLADMRELIMVSWLAQKVDDDVRVRDELARRIRDLRTGASRKGWQPF